MRLPDATRLIPRQLIPSRALGWNIMFLLWAAILLLALTHHDSLTGGEARPQIGEVDVQPLPEPQPSHSPLDMPGADDLAGIPLGAAGGLQMPDADEPAWPEPEVIPFGYPNPAKAAGERHGTLNWMSAHQNVEGYWSASGFSVNSGRGGALATHSSERDGFADPDTDAGPIDADVAVTSLALQSYVQSGYDHKEGEHRAACRKAILWLRAQQSDEGFTGARGTRDHALATLALCEVYGLSGDQIIKPLATKALGRLIEMRHAHSGWGDQVWGEADVISTAYALMALKSARMTGIELEYEIDGLGEFLDALNDEGDTRYSGSRSDPPAMLSGRPPVCAAAWMVCALYSGHTDHLDARITDRTALLTRDENLPKWEGLRIDFEYWWLASIGIYSAASQPAWEKWQRPLADTLIGSQRGYSDFDKAREWTKPTELDEHGSWDAADPWHRDGRVAVTALAGLCLQTYYRYFTLSSTTANNGG